MLTYGYIFIFNDTALYVLKDKGWSESLTEISLPEFCLHPDVVSLLVLHVCLCQGMSSPEIHSPVSWSGHNNKTFI